MLICSSLLALLKLQHFEIISFPTSTESNYIWFGNECKFMQKFHTCISILGYKEINRLRTGF